MARGFAEQFGGLRVCELKPHAVNGCPKAVDEEWPLVLILIPGCIGTRMGVQWVHN